MKGDQKMPPKGLVVKTHQWKPVNVEHKTKPIGSGKAHHKVPKAKK